MIRLENTRGGSNKFYEIWTADTSGQHVVMARYGAIGTPGTTITKDAFDMPRNAERYIGAVVKSKLRRGYVQVADLSSVLGTPEKPEVVDGVPKDVVNPDGDLAFETDAGVRYAWRKFVGAADCRDAVETMEAEHEGGAEFVREVFGRLHDGDLIEKAEPDQWAQWAHDRASEVPEFAAMADEVRGDRWESGCVAVAVSRAVMAQMDQDAQDQENGQQNANQGAGEGSQCDQDGDQDGDGEGQGNGPALPESGAGTRQAIRQALRQAQEQIENEREAAEAMASGWGTGGGSDVFPGDGLAQKAALADLVKAIPDFRRIMEIAGRMRGVAEAKRKERTREVPEEVADVDQGADFARTLPVELAKLRGAPGLRLDFFRRYVEKSTLVYSLQGNEAKKRGPIVVLLDCSGSMEGQRDIWSKALAIAMLNVATTERRPFAAITYDGDWRNVYAVDRSSANSAERVRNTAELLNERADGHSTDWERPLRKAWDVMEDEDFAKADVVMLTDGSCRVSDEFKREWSEWREARGVTAFGFCIDGRVDNLDAIMDEVHTIDSRAAEDNDGFTAMVNEVVGDTIN